MDATKLKENIWIDGFDSEFSIVSTASSMWFGKYMENLLYAGKTSEVPEDVANESVIPYYLGSNFEGNFENCEFGFENDKRLFPTSKDLIQTICDNEFCLIYKTN